MTHQPLINDANQRIVVDGEPDAVSQFFSPEYVVHGTDGAHTMGHKGVTAWMERLHRAFTDVRVEILVLVEADDRITWLRTVHGVQTGAYLGFPASSQSIVWRDMVVSRVEDGRIAEEWVVTDLAERLLLGRKKGKA